jgi:hypothetical protein
MTPWWKRARVKATSTESALGQLLSIASPALCEQPPQVPLELLDEAGDLAASLVALLHEKNGFLAFESALHLFPAGSVHEGYDLIAWNRADLWRHSYEDLASGFLFFAEDLFGDQFALRSGRVYRFTAETGQADELAEDLEGWAARLLGDYCFETGHPLAHAWQEQYGPLRPGERLIPKRLFALGGDYSVENLTKEDAVRGMRIRGPIAVLTRNLPNGTKLRLQVVE